MSASLNGLGAITLFVEDLHRSRLFYEKVFGLKVIYEDADSAAFDFGNTILNLIDLPAARELLGPGALEGRTAVPRFQLTIRVEDADAVCAVLDWRGVSRINGPINREWGKRTTSFADPDGNVWEIAQDLPSAEKS